jgi:hypothetical protein
MTVSINVALQVIALVLFVMAAAALPSRLNLTAMGLAVWMLSLLV